MTIGIVRSNLAATGGAERYALNLIRELTRLGHRVHIFSARVPDRLPPEVVVHLFHPPRGPRLPRALRQLAFERWLAKESVQAPLDLLFTMERTWPSDVFRAGDGVHREWLTICRHDAGFVRRVGLGWQPFHRRLLRIERSLFQPQNTRFIVCNSQMVADEIAQGHGYPNDRMRVIPNGVDFAEFQPVAPEERARLRAEQQLKTDEIALLFVGSGFWRKGLDHAIELAARLQPLLAPRPLRLFAVGKGDIGTHRQQAKALGISEQVEFCGGLPPDEIRQWYQLSDVLLFPTRYDPFANVCLEANACGLPVVTTTRNGFSEHIEEGVNGMVLDEQFFAALSDGASKKMNELAQFCGVRHDATRIRDAVAALSLETHTKALVELLEELHREKTGGRQT